MGTRRPAKGGGQIIPPLSRLPEPDRQGVSGDWTSKVWTRGRHGLRIRHLRDSGVLTEYQDGASVRSVEGSLGFLVTFAEQWFEAQKNRSETS